MGMTIEEPDNIWVRNLKQLNKLDKECKEYKEQGHCAWTDCRECDYQNVCEEYEVDNGNGNN